MTGVGNVVLSDLIAAAHGFTHLASGLERRKYEGRMDEHRRYCRYQQIDAAVKRWVGWRL